MQTKRYISLDVHAIYVLLTGLQLVFVPNMLLGMFGMPPTSELWIKVLGLVILSLSIVYYTIGREGSPAVVRSCMWARWIVSAGFVLFVLTGQAPTTLILFAAIDLLTATWTWFELKK